jgi:hypothetical protein
LVIPTMAPYYETNRRISQPSYRNYQGYATQGSLRVPYINRCSCIPARPCTHGNYGKLHPSFDVKFDTRLACEHIVSLNARSAHFVSCLLACEAPSTSDNLP